LEAGVLDDSLGRSGGDDTDADTSCRVCLHTRLDKLARDSYVLLRDSCVPSDEPVLEALV